MEDLHELIYSMNQSIAIQAWEIDPDMETEKFTIAIGMILTMSSFLTGLW
jgi:hypothetical protein